MATLFNINIFQDNIIKLKGKFLTVTMLHLNSDNKHKYQPPKAGLGHSDPHHGYIIRDKCGRHNHTKVNRLNW